MRARARALGPLHGMCRTLKYAIRRICESSETAARRTRANAACIGGAAEQRSAIGRFTGVSSFKFTLYIFYRWQPARSTYIHRALYGTSLPRYTPYAAAAESDETAVQPVH